MRQGVLGGNAYHRRGGCGVAVLAPLGVHAGDTGPRCRTGSSHGDFIENPELVSSHNLDVERLVTL